MTSATVVTVRHQLYAGFPLLIRVQGHLKTRWQRGSFISINVPGESPKDLQPLPLICPLRKTVTPRLQRRRGDHRDYDSRICHSQRHSPHGAAKYGPVLDSPRTSLVHCQPCVKIVDAVTDLNDAIMGNTLERSAS